MGNTTDEMTTAARKGIALLDAEGPAGWRERAGEEGLDMRATFGCALARSYGTDFFRARQALFPRAGLAVPGDPGYAARAGALAIEHGFQLDHEERDGEGLDAWEARLDAEYAELTGIWRQLLSGEG